MCADVGHTVQPLENDYMIIDIFLIVWKMQMVNCCVNIDNRSGSLIPELRALYRELKPINRQSPPLPLVRSLHIPRVTLDYELPTETLSCWMPNMCSQPLSNIYANVFDRSQRPRAASSIPRPHMRANN